MAHKRTTAHTRSGGASKMRGEGHLINAAGDVSNAHLRRLRTYYAVLNAAGSVRGASWGS